MASDRTRFAALREEKGTPARSLVAMRILIHHLVPTPNKLLLLGNYAAFP